MKPSIPGDGSVTPTTPATPGDTASINPLPFLYNKISNVLNPFKYFTTDQQSQQQFNNFLEKQYNPITADLKLYPFTVENPTASWFSKFKTAVFGETQSDAVLRLEHRLYALRDYEAIKVDNSITSLGLGINNPTNIAKIFNSLPPTPKFISMDLPNEWNEQIAESIPSSIATSSKVTTEMLDEAISSIPNLFTTPRSLI